MYRHERKPLHPHENASKGKVSGKCRGRYADLISGVFRN